MSRVRWTVLTAAAFCVVVVAGAGGFAMSVRAGTRRDASGGRTARARSSERQAHAPGTSAGAAAASAGGRRAPSPPTPPVSLQPPAAIPLTQGWSYRADPGSVGVRARWRDGAPRLRWMPVSIPNDFNPVVSNTTDAGMVGWYKVWFRGPPASAGRSWEIRFDSVRRHARVWLNGTRIGSSSDPYAPFALPATSLLPGRSNLLVVRVDNFRGAMPEDWWNWGGIVGPVTLVPVGRIQLLDLGVMPQLGCSYSCGDVLVEGTLRNLSTITLSPRIVVHGARPAARPSRAS